MSKSNGAIDWGTIKTARDVEQTIAPGSRAMLTCIGSIVRLRWNREKLSDKQIHKLKLLLEHQEEKMVEGKRLFTGKFEQLFVEVYEI